MCADKLVNVQSYGSCSSFKYVGITLVNNGCLKCFPKIKVKELVDSILFTLCRGAHFKSDKKFLLFQVR